MGAAYPDEKKSYIFLFTFDPQYFQKFNKIDTKSNYESDENLQTAKCCLAVLPIGVAWIFDWGRGGPKPQITCNDVITNFEREFFVGAKIS